MLRKYLIVKCVELGDQWECDADRKPITLVDNWRKYLKSHRKGFYEVYELQGDKFVLIKGYDD